MFDINNTIENTLDKEIYVVQTIMHSLDFNEVSYEEWERLLPILISLVEEQKNTSHIKYRGQ